MNKDKIRHFGRRAYRSWRWFIWGLRWLAVVIFIVLLMVGISVKLPWKMLVCLAVVPIVGIFVPKKVQTWIWVGLTLFLAITWLWVRLPESNSSDWSVYQFNDEADRVQNGRQVADADNAAIRYEALLSAYDESIFYYPRLNDETRYAIYNTPWNRQEYPLLAEWLGGYQTGIDTLLEITKLPECRFATPYNFIETGVQQKRLNQMKGWARMLLWSANLDLAEGRTAKAIEKQRAVLQMARHLYQQKTLFDQVGAFDVELMAFRGLITFMVDHCEEPETLEAIEADFEQIDTGWAKSWAEIVEREKLIAKNIMGLFYEVDETGRTRIAHSAMYALQEGLGYKPQKLFLNQHEMNRLAVVGLWLSLPTSPEGIANLVDQRFDYYSLESQKGVPLPGIPIQYTWRMGLNFGSLIDWLAMEKMRYFWALNGKFRQHQALQELTRLFSALKQYYLDQGQWPEDMQVLVPDYIIALPEDPVNNKPFMYRREQDGFRLYSLGANGTDDAGLNIPKENKDDAVFWPRMAEPEDFDGTTLIEKAGH